jgi:hypothetical protein
MRRADGSVMYYTFQHRTIFKGPWLELDKPMECVLEEDPEWSFSSFDYFHLKGPCDKKIQPGLKVPRYSTHTHEVWAATRSYGYFDLRKARAALRHVRKRDAEGAYDAADSYRKKHQHIRHEFRLVQVVYVPDRVEVVEVDQPPHRNLRDYLYLPPGSKTKTGDMLATIPPGGWVQIEYTGVKVGSTYDGEIQRPKKKVKTKKRKRRKK